mmetsp:Transcript_72357/g.84059  ORF Transcript_72357/g.84059 Transcript_72357/m.84059 type:complete len:88 (+) Transcript_72357:3-266(+)
MWECEFPVSLFQNYPYRSFHGLNSVRCVDMVQWATEDVEVLVLEWSSKECVVQFSDGEPSMRCVSRGERKRERVLWWRCGCGGSRRC